MNDPNQTFDCPHGEWGHREPGGVLCCLTCGELWPGLADWPPEPFPVGRNPGYGALPDGPWGRRVDAMVAELGEVA